MTVLRLLVAYDGTDFHGWQRQTRGPTIQASLEAALATMTRLPTEAVRVAGSGRTDAGVHAEGQVASLELPTPPRDLRVLQRGLNAILPEAIRVRRIEEAPAGFHARYSATGKVYRYSIFRAAHPPVFDRRYVLWYPRPLDLDAMAAAARQLVGRRDFASFASQAARQRSTVRDLRRLDLEVRGDHLHCTFEADGFLYNMVRAITGTLLEVGRGRRRPGELATILAARSRPVAGENAPARGLCLVRVHYREEAFR